MNNKKEAGFSLMEMAMALTILGVILAYSMPMFLYSRITNIKNEIRTGATIVAQRIMDDIRSKKISDLPTYATNGSNIKNIPTDLNNITSTESKLSNALNRQYLAKITYCELATDCNTNKRRIKIEVQYQNQTVYEIEGSYAEIN